MKKLWRVPIYVFLVTAAIAMTVGDWNKPLTVNSSQNEVCPKYRPREAPEHVADVLGAFAFVLFFGLAVEGIRILVKKLAISL